ncbi:MAG: hypothetical protein WC069_04450 [Candidatus Shapirobacteria bacterium]
MDNIIEVNSSTARNDFYTLMNAVYIKNKTVVIKKSGMPIMTWNKIIDKPKKSFMDFEGMLTEKEGNRLLKLVESGRRDGSHKKKYLANWK